MIKHSKKIFFDLTTKGDYDVVAKAYPFAAILGSLGYIGFYFTDPSLYENIYIRIICAVLFFQLFFLCKYLNTFSKILIESIFALCLPLFYSYFFFATDQNLKWQLGFIFCGFTYGTLTGRITNVFTVYPFFSIMGFFLYDIFFQRTRMEYFFDGADVLIASNVSALLSSGIKLFFTSFIMTTIELRNEQQQVLEQTKLKNSAEENSKLKENLGKIKRLTAVAKLSEGLSGEFNNLLRVIQDQTYQLKKMYDEDDLKSKRISTILGVVEKSNAIIDQLTIFNQKSELKKQEVNIHSILEETVNIIFKPFNNDITFQFNFGARMYSVFGDAALLQNSFHNIIINAIHAMPGGGLLVISTKNKVITTDNSEKEMLVVSFSDTGTGMTDFVKERIFEPFFTTKRSGKGSGMGLAMVYGTIKQHDGSIGVESAPGKGTTFLIELPCTSGDMLQREAQLSDENGNVNNG